MWFATTAIAISTVSLICVCPPASAQAGGLADIIALQAKADQAQVRDRCFLYAELVSRLIEQAGQQFNSGDNDQASDTLKQVRRYAEKMQLGIADDSKRLKNSELLVERASHHLNDILHAASYEDRPALEMTLKQLNQVQAQLMIQTFKK
jgi:hypothetical protein